ncbi:MAG: hypothetical protein ACI4GD_04090 [Lachnospiraceae bacterium]
MDRTGKWMLSPAYDITFSYNPTNKWLHAHQMTVNGKTTKIGLSDLLKAGINEKTVEYINSVIDANMVIV